MESSRIRVEKIRGELCKHLEIAIGKNDKGKWFVQTADISEKTDLADAIVEPTDYRTALKVATNVAKLTGMKIVHWDMPSKRIKIAYEAVSEKEDIEGMKKLINLCAKSSQVNVQFVSENISNNDTKCRADLTVSFDSDNILYEQETLRYMEEVFADLKGRVEMHKLFVRIGDIKC